MLEGAATKGGAYPIITTQEIWQLPIGAQWVYHTKPGYGLGWRGSVPANIRDLISSAFNAIKLNILVFGPQVHTISTDVRTSKLQNKRIEIRGKLEAMGHHVRYAEDLVDPSIDGAAGNAFLQELVIMKEYDLIVNIVGSPGSIAEATAVSMRPQLAQKCSLFLDSEHVNGLVAQVCKNAEDVGAHFKLYQYPADLDDCHLFGFVKDRVEKLQKIMYLL